MYPFVVFPLPAFPRVPWSLLSVPSVQVQYHHGLEADRNTSVWSLSEPTNVCRELGGKHSRAFISALKIVAPFSQGVK